MSRRGYRRRRGRGRALDLRDYAPATQGTLTLVDSALPPEGVDLGLRIEAPGTVRVELADWTTDLPSVPGLGIAPRPPGIMPVPAGNYASTRVRRSFEVRG